MRIRSEDPAPYCPVALDTTQEEDNIIKKALDILKSRIHEGDAMSSPRVVREYLQLRFSQLPYEVFVVMFIDTRGKLLCIEEMFRGTLTQTSVYPREVIKAALHHNACSVVFCHNHPSGNAVPSRADHALTQTIKAALALVDVRVLDHIIVGLEDTYSFAERSEL